MTIHLLKEWRDNKIRMMIFDARIMALKTNASHTLVFFPRSSVQKTVLFFFCYKFNYAYLQRGIGLFSKNDLKRMNAWRGRWSGTSWPAPATVTNVSPLYIWLHPPTYIPIELELVRTYAETTIILKNQSKESFSLLQETGTK